MPDVRWGLTLPFAGVPLRDHPDFRRAEAAGYDDLWTGETAGPDGFTPLAVAAAVTERIRLATGIVNPYTRGPRAAGPAGGRAADASGGRFVLGIGSSSNVIVERWNEVPFVKPLSKVRESVENLRPVFAGERGAGGFKLETPPAEPIPIIVAALRGKMLALAAELGDGAFTNFLPLCGLPQVASVSRRVRRGATRRSSPAASSASPARGGARARQACSPPTAPCRSTRSSSAGWAGPSSSTRWSRPGRAATASRRSSWRPRTWCARSSSSAPRRQRERLRAFVAGGITTLILTPMTGPDRLEEMIDALAPS